MIEGTQSGTSPEAKGGRTGTAAQQPPIRFGVLGLANIAERAVLPAIEDASGAELAAVATRSRQKATRYSQALAGSQHPRIYAGESAYEELLADPAIDAVYVPVPNHLHSVWTTRALDAGKHVLCEKPLAATPAEVDLMRRHASQTGLVLMEAFMYRFNPQHRRVAAMLRDGAIGTAKLFRGSFTVRLSDPAQDIRFLAQPGAGSLFDVGVYPINTARWLFGELPLTAFVESIPGPANASDLTAIILGFTEDRLAVIDCALSLGYNNRYEVVGTSGSIRVERPYASPPFSATARDLQTTLISADGTASVASRQADVSQYVAEVEAFCKAATGEPSGWYPTREAAEDAAVLAACLASAKSGKPERVIDFLLDTVGAEH